MWDVFISYASEDREIVAAPLADALRHRGLQVWFDGFELKPGDDLRKTIDAGLAQSRVGVVIVSPRFVEKTWTQRELAGLTAREGSGDHTVLPVLHDLDRAAFKQFSPTLAGKVNLSTTDTLEVVADGILKVVDPEAELPEAERQMRTLRTRLAWALDERREADVLALADAWEALDPEAPEPEAIRAWIRGRAGDTQAALDHAEAAVEAAPRRPVALVTRGLARASLGETAGARADLETALLQPPRTPEDLVALSQAATFLGRPEEALTFADRALPQRERQGPARAARAMALFGLGRYDEAREEIDAVLENGLPDAGLLVTLAQLHAARGEQDAAHGALDRALQAEPKHAVALLMRAEMIYASEPEQTVRLASEVLADVPDHPVALVTRAGGLFQMGRADSGRRDAEAALDAPAETPLDWLTRARALGMLGRHDESADAASRVIQAVPDHPQALGIRAHASFLAGRFADAVRDTSTALERVPLHYPCRVLRAHASLALGDHEAATRDAAEILRTHPADPVARRIMTTAQSPVRRTLARFISKRVTQKQADDDASGAAPASG